KERPVLVPPSFCSDNHQQFVVKSGTGLESGCPGRLRDRDTRIQSMRSRKKSPSAARSKRGLQVVSGRGGSRRVPEGSGHALALKDSSDPSTEHPNRLPLLPLRSDVVFPQTVVPLVINRPSGIRL